MNNIVQWYCITDTTQASVSSIELRLPHVYACVQDREVEPYLEQQGQKQMSCTLIYIRTSIEFDLAMLDWTTLNVQVCISEKEIERL